MQANAIILTPTKGFGELIRQVLADSTDLEPVLLSSAKQALEGARRTPISLLVLDADQIGLDLQAYISEIREAAPDIHLIVIPAEENPNDPILSKLGADAVLPSPFYLPNLVEVVEHLFGPLSAKPQSSRTTYGSAPVSVSPVVREENPAPSWLQDVTLAAQYLTRLSLESASQAALITRGDKVWAYAGELPQRATEELAGTVSHHMESGDKADLARFIHLDATRTDHMLYATSLGDDYMLALVFDAQVPFSQMRSQVSKLANALVTAPLQEAEKQTPQSRAEPNVRMEERAEQPPLRGAERGFGAPIPRADLPSARAARVSATGTLRMGGQTGQLEPLTAGSYDLHYSYVLIPRLPTHRFEGDLAEKLAAWLPQLCLAFAWRLEDISLQPGYLQWSISVQPDTSPESVVNTLEKHLSERIFEEFPRLKRENPSGQFFAPGFLIVNGAQPTMEVIAEYIQQTRARQGA